MSSEPINRHEAPHLAVSAQKLGKRYFLGEYASLGRTLDFVLPWREAFAPRVAALADVSFRVPRGICFGLVGSNGAGKTTLLQILAGITLPSAGTITVRGRVLPLLSVGAGFHPELTGRENVRLFGAILGLPATDVQKQMGDIFDFAEVSDHIDTPLKRYSDGMKSRLSFGIALLFPADVYLLDEVLAVVDESFRDRCADAIKGIVSDGRTVLLTSHDATQIRALCDQVVWLEGGRVRAVGGCDQVVDEYVQATAGAV
jgi:ABC-type polysaccharide/polyol phosphate transport system ATPase subunit